MLESTAAIYNGKIVDTGAKELPLIHVYMNSNLIFDCIRIQFKDFDCCHIGTKSMHVVVSIKCGY